jgi:hypothetical protein
MNPTVGSRMGLRILNVEKSNMGITRNVTMYTLMPVYLYCFKGESLLSICIELRQLRF